MVRRCHGDRSMRPRASPTRRLGSFVITPARLRWCGEGRKKRTMHNTAPRALEHSCRRCSWLLPSRALSSFVLLLPAQQPIRIFAHSSPIVPLSHNPASRSCPPFIGLQAWTQLRIRAASGRGRVSEACGASASHRARCRKGRHRACRRQTEIWRVFIWPDRELPSRSVTLTQ